MSAAIHSQGVVLQRGNGAGPEVFSDVAEIVDFDGPSGESSEIDVTHLNSTAREYLLGLRDEGEISFTANLVPQDVQQKGLRADRDNKVLRNFKIILTDVADTTLSFAAFVKSFGISGSTDDKVVANFTLRVSGAVTWAP